MPEPKLPLIIEPDELESQLGLDDLLVLDLSRQQTYAKYHVPGAVHMEYSTIIMAQPPAMGLLPEAEHLSNALSSAGITQETHVVAYDDEGNANAGRLLWTLDVIGHANFSLLNGGLQAWLNEDHRIEQHLNEPRLGNYKVAHHANVIADKDYILARLGDSNTVILDTRTPEEFRGTDKRAARGGHIPGAVNMDWTLAMDRERNLRFKSTTELRKILEKLGVTPDKEIITHCQTHHRSSHTYVMLKSMAYPRIKGYPGSWSEWGNALDLPIEN